jgi:hypothetical protein
MKAHTSRELYCARITITNVSMAAAAAELLELLGHDGRVCHATLPTLFEAAVMSTTDEGQWGDVVGSLMMECVSGHSLHSTCTNVGVVHCGVGGGHSQGLAAMVVAPAPCRGHYAVSTHCSLCVLESHGTARSNHPTQTNLHISNTNSVHA